MRVRHILANNPSPMTGTGTNSYLVGEGTVALIDPGPNDPAHLAALLAALDPGENVAAILVTHAHLDHTGLTRALIAATSAPVFAFGDCHSGRSAVMQTHMANGLTGGGEGVDPAFAPDRLLTDGQILTLGNLTIEVLHTPGHMGGHLCFACEGQLFSGDHVMGWASSLVSPPDGDMGAYMTSLRRLATRDWHIIHPGHGAPIQDPAARLATLIAHRETREAEIMTALTAHPGTAEMLAARIYTETPQALLPAATRNVLAHLIDLASRNRVTCTGPLTADSMFFPA
jgi:glyoxylase-like metal-dependent hydrolase (beta-lactamase superfamily II)